MPKHLKWGIIPAVCYAAPAGFIGLSELNCDAWMLCGYAFALITYPSHLTLGEYLYDRGIKISFTSTPQFSDYVQIALHVAVCAVLVFVVCYSLARLLVWLNNYNEALNRRDLAKQLQRKNQARS